MKLLPLLVAGAAALGVALLAIIVAGLATPASARLRAARADAAPFFSAAHLVPKIDAAVWSRLDTAQLPELVAHLRASGFPPWIVRALVVARLDDQFAARRAALEAGEANLPYWQESHIVERHMAALYQLNREERALRRSLLGADDEFDELSDPVQRFYSGQRFGHLPPEKVAQLGPILEQYSDRKQDMFATGSWDPKLVAAMDAERHAALAALLSPQELLDYDLRNSTTATRLRENLSAFGASEEEFRTLYGLQVAWEQKYPAADRSVFGSPSTLQAEQDLDDQIKAALGPDRYHDYQRANDYEYRETDLLASRLELPPATAADLSVLKTDAEQRALAIRTDRSLSTTDRNARLAALADSTQTQAAALLGPRGIAAYPQYGGEWLTRLKPKPSSPK